MNLLILKRSMLPKRFRQYIGLFLYVCIFYFLGNESLHASLKSDFPSDYQAHTRVTLIPEYQTIQSHQSFRIAIHMKMDPDWHVYWVNPGDSGLPPSVKWSFPDNFQPGPIQWPIPKRIDLPPLTSYGYEDEVIFLVDVDNITDSSTNVSSPIDITANIHWLACKIECLPGQTQLHLKLNVSNRSSSHLDIFKELQETFQRQSPITNGLKDLSVNRRESDAVIQFGLRDGRRVTKAEFFPFDDLSIEHSSKQIFVSHPTSAKLNIKLLKSFQDEQLKGILVVEEEKQGVSVRQGFLIDEDIQYSSSEELIGTTDSGGRGMSFILAILFAFLGGLILNVMPCVLPVLSIKIMRIIKQTEDSKRSLLEEGFLFSCGIVVCFWLLFLILLGLKFGGYHLGWGFQFQSPIFILAMAVLFTVLALNAWGVFDIHIGISQKVNTSAQHKSIESFFNGFLATIVATPCTAPFMGSALGYALTQPIIVGFGIFTALGLGMAFPFFLLCLFPRGLRFLPKPGLWMEHVKKIFGFVFLATVLWLVWIFAWQTGTNAQILLLAGLILISLAIYIWESAQQTQTFFHRSKKIFVTCLLILISAFLVFKQALSFTNHSQEKSVQGNEGELISWTPYSKEKLQNALTSGQGVFIDFTAKWCLTCQVNERVALYQQKVADYFEQHNILLLKADWTNYDPAITEALNEYGKSSIPVYVYYPPGEKNWSLLPEILTVTTVMNHLLDASP